MINRPTAAALALFASLSSPAAAAPPLAPTANWVVDFAPSQCTAARSYGTKDKPLALVLKPAVLGDVMTLAIIRDGAHSDVSQHNASITLDQGPPIPVSMLAFSPKGQKRRVEMINLSLASFAAVRQSGSLSIAGHGVARRNFLLSEMGALAKAMDTCLADLKQVWNVADDAQAGLKQGPRSTRPLTAYFDSDDYPQVALRSDQSGLVAFALLIDEVGKIADCTVIQTSGVATLDAQSCAIINERAAFVPAVGVDGKPAKSAIVQRIRWALP